MASASYRPLIFKYVGNVSTTVTGEHVVIELDNTKRITLCNDRRIKPDKHELRNPQDKRVTCKKCKKLLNMCNYYLSRRYGIIVQENEVMHKKTEKTIEENARYTEQLEETVDDLKKELALILTSQNKPVKAMYICKITVSRTKPYEITETFDDIENLNRYLKKWSIGIIDGTVTVHKVFVDEHFDFIIHKEATVSIKEK